MAVTSGSVDSGGYDGRVVRASWSVSGNKINISFSAVGGTTGHFYNHHNERFYVNGNLVYIGEDSVSRYEGEIYSCSIDITSSLSIEMHGGIYSYSDNINKSASWDVVAYLTINTFEIQSKTVNSVVVKWATSNPRDYIAYILNNGNEVGSGTYGETVASDEKSGTFNIKDLAPNTTYTLKIKVRRTDSQLWTTSDTITFTTYQIAQINTANNFNHGDSDVINITNPSGSSMSLVMKIGNTQILSQSVSTGNNTISFNDTNLDTIYKLYGTNNSLTVTYIVSITVNGTTYSHSKTCTITFKGNQKTAKTNVNSSWKRAKTWTNVNGTWRRGVYWENINGTWGRCI